MNFDTDDTGSSIADQTMLTDEYDGFGVTFEQFNSGLLTVAVLASALERVSDPHVLVGSTYSNVAGGGGGGGFEATFDTPATAFGLWVGGAQPSPFQPTTLALLDGNSGLITSVEVQDLISSGPNSIFFLGVTSTQPIASVQVAVGANDFVWFDDLTFGTAIPEPTTLGLAVVTGVGVGLLRRRARH